MSNSVPKFDITTQEGRQSAMSWFNEHGWKLNPYLWIYWKIGKSAWNTISAPFSDAVRRDVEAQKNAAIDIIRAGKENNVDELEISISEKVGIGFGAEVEGVPVEFIAGQSGKMTIKVKYKD